MEGRNTRTLDAGKVPPTSPKGWDKGRKHNQVMGIVPKIGLKQEVLHNGSHISASCAGDMATATSHAIPSGSESLHTPGTTLVHHTIHPRAGRRFLEGIG